jgi:hypothetical protein
MMTVSHADYAAFCLLMFAAVSSMVIGLLIELSEGKTKKYDLKNIFKGIRNIFETILIGKRFIAKIDDTWRLVRGWVKDNNLNAVFPPDYKINIISRIYWIHIDSDWSDEYIKEKIVKLNIMELKSKHHKLNDVNILKNRSIEYMEYIQQRITI